MVAAFDRDVADTEAWIDEKLKGFVKELANLGLLALSCQAVMLSEPSSRVRSELERQGQCSSIEDKMKRLQKHQALEAELAANRKRVDQVLQRGKELHIKHRDAGVRRLLLLSLGLLSFLFKLRKMEFDI